VAPVATGPFEAVEANLAISAMRTFWKRPNSMTVSDR
jgi:hypothetical protein